MRQEEEEKEKEKEKERGIHTLGRLCKRWIKTIEMRPPIALVAKQQASLYEREKVRLLSITQKTGRRKGTHVVALLHTDFAHLALEALPVVRLDGLDEPGRCHEKARGMARSATEMTRDHLFRIAVSVQQSGHVSDIQRSLEKRVPLTGFADHSPGRTSSPPPSEPSSSPRSPPPSRPS